MEFRRFLAPLLLILLLLILQYCLWFQSGGLIDMVRFKKQLAVEQQTNDKLKKRNEKIWQQVKHLQKNKDAVESRARQELGMVKQGETFYQVVNKQ